MMTLVLIIFLSGMFGFQILFFFKSEREHFKIRVSLCKKAISGGLLDDFFTA